MTVPKGYRTDGTSLPKDKKAKKKAKKSDLEKALEATAAEDALLSRLRVPRIAVNVKQGSKEKGSSDRTTYTDSLIRLGAEGRRELVQKLIDAAAVIAASDDCYDGHSTILMLRNKG